MATHDEKNPLINFDTTLNLPIKMDYDVNRGKYRLIDKYNILIADNLTKEIAESFVHAANYFLTSVDFLRSFIDHEDIVKYSTETTPYDAIISRNAMCNDAMTFMAELGFIEEPLPLHVTTFSEWRENLLNTNFYEVIGDIKYE